MITAWASAGILVVAVVLQDDLDPGAVGGHLVDLAHRHAEHPHVAALVERHGAREVGRDGLLAAVATEHDDGAGDDQGHDDEGHDRPLQEAHADATPVERVGHRRQVLDVGVEPRSGAERVGEDPVEGLHQPQAVVDVVLVLVQHGEHVLEVAERGLQVLAALRHDRGQLRGKGRGGHEQVVHRVAARDQGPEEDVGVPHQRDDVLVAGVEHRGDALEVLQQRVDLLVAGGDGLARARKRR